MSKLRFNPCRQYGYDPYNSAARIDVRVDFLNYRRRLEATDVLIRRAFKFLREHRRDF